MSRNSFLLWSPRAPDHYPRTSSVQWRTTLMMMTMKNTRSVLLMMMESLTSMLSWPDLEHIPIWCQDNSAVLQEQWHYTAVPLQAWSSVRASPVSTPVDHWVLQTLESDTRLSLIRVTMRDLETWRVMMSSAFIFCQPLINICSYNMIITQSREE